MKSDSFGAKLRGMREGKGLGLRELAGRAGISPAFLSKIEAGKEKAPAEPKLRALARVLEVDPDVMLAMAGRLSAEVVKVIQKYPKEYTALLISLRALNQEQLQATGRSIMKTYEIQIPPDQMRKVAALFKGVKLGKPQEWSFPGAPEIKTLSEENHSYSIVAAQPTAKPVNIKRRKRTISYSGERP
jgi:transcriptional regulator with XRE-family HTH domain